MYEIREEIMNNLKDEFEDELTERGYEFTNEATNKIFTEWAEKKQMLLIQSNLQWFNNGRDENEQLDVELEVYDGNKASLYKGDTMIIGLQPLHVINMTIAAINNYLDAR
jgi:uncharacterized protein YecA (UPF0149 family)